MPIQFDYFYGNEAEQFTFYRIPKILVTSPTFKRVSDSAKLLYGLMLDRMGLSIRNGWVDDENRAYIFFTTNDVMEQMCCGTEKATKLLAELDGEKGIGLIERKKQGQGKPAIIYLKKFYISENNDRDLRLSETEIPDFRKSKVKTFENRNPRLSEVESTDFRESKSNYNKYNNTDFNYTEKNNTETSDMKTPSFPTAFLMWQSAMCLSEILSCLTRNTTSIISLFMITFLRKLWIRCDRAVLLPLLPPPALWISILQRCADI